MGVLMVMKGHVGQRSSVAHHTVQQILAFLLSSVLTHRRGEEAEDEEEE